MTRLILVRHAMPDVDPESDPATWTLTPQSMAEARELLRPVIPEGSVLLASNEPKARQTLEAADLGEVVTDHRLREVARREAFAEDFRSARRAWVVGRGRQTWEQRVRVAERIQHAVDAGLERTAETGAPALVVAGHGMSLTAWLVSREHLPDGDPAAEFWAGLSFPDAWEIPLAGGSPRRLLG